MNILQGFVCFPTQSVLLKGIIKLAFCQVLCELQENLCSFKVLFTIL